MDKFPFTRDLIISFSSGLFGTVLVAIIAYWATIRQFLNEKKVETIQDRYITRGIVDPMSELAEAYEINRRNYLKIGTALGLLRASLKDAQMKTYRQQIEKIENEMEQVKVNKSTKHTMYLLFSPTGENKLVWEWVIKAEADVINFNLSLRSSVFTDIYGCYEKVEAGEITRDHLLTGGYIDKLVQSLLTEHNEVTKNEALFGSMQRILLIVDKKNPKTISELVKIKRTKEFIGLAKDMEDEYKRLFQKKHVD